MGGVLFRLPYFIHLRFEIVLGIEIVVFEMQYAHLRNLVFICVINFLFCWEMQSAHLRMQICISARNEICICNWKVSFCWLKLAINLCQFSDYVERWCTFYWDGAKGVPAGARAPYEFFRYSVNFWKNYRFFLNVS